MIFSFNSPYDMSSQAYTLTWYRGSQCNKHHCCDWVFQAHCAAKMRSQVPCRSLNRLFVCYRLEKCQSLMKSEESVSWHHTNDSGEQSDHADGDDKAGPAVPVLCGWDKSEQNLPEDCEEMHDVVETRRQFLFPALLIVIVLACWEGGQTKRGERGVGLGGQFDFLITVFKHRTSWRYAVHMGGSSLNQFYLESCKSDLHLGWHMRSLFFT